MTTLMNQVTCSLCNKKTDELQWNKHIISTDHLSLCKGIKDKKNNNKVFGNDFQRVS